MPGLNSGLPGETADPNGIQALLPQQLGPVDACLGINRLVGKEVEDIAHYVCPVLSTGMAKLIEPTWKSWHCTGQMMSLGHCSRDCT
jgi:hypothetical protein